MECPFRRSNLSSWTSVFSEGSTVVTDWIKGSKALFLNGEGQGIIARVNDHIPNEYLSIKHIGNYDNGIEDYDSEEVKSWGDSYENYKLSTRDGKSLLTVELDTEEEYKVHFEEKWPIALEKVKELAEG